MTEVTVLLDTHHDPERKALLNPSVGPLQTSEVGGKRRALLLGQRQELKSVVISTAVPHD
jgi:hypothetical protein